MHLTDIPFLQKLIDAPSPTGFEVPAARVFRERMEGVADTIETNVLGSVHARLLGKKNGPSVLLAGHLDEIGLMVKYIDDAGFLSFYPLGGVDAAILPGTRVDVHTASGVLRGVMGRKPIHLLDEEDRKKVTPIDKLFIDVGLDGDKAKEKIRLGDPITFAASFEEFGERFAVSRAFDDKLGVYIAARVLEEVKKAGGSAGDVIAAGTVQEEIGLRGGTTSVYSVNPTIAVSCEVGHATDYPGIDKRKHGEGVCGNGPLIARGPNINPIVFDRLVAAAEETGTPYQIDPVHRATGTDANAFQISRGGKAAGLISIPLRYMHTPTEVLCLDDLEAAVTILTAFILHLDEKTDLTPGSGI